MPEISEAAYDVLVACALNVDGSTIDWNLIAREAMRRGTAGPLLEGVIWEDSKAAVEARLLLATASVGDARTRVDGELRAAESVGAELVTVLDDAYPANLRLIHNLPPFLFVLGRPVGIEDARAVAVVGTRDASEEGLRRADRMARRLSDQRVTVVSGLARGIDTAAHRATLGAGGRTIAVIGTGITRTYPSENAALADEIVAKDGAILSQFWPSSGPARWTFPRRNVTMSGVAQGTVVIEASKTSGAKMQARLALEHGKRVFLVGSLVTAQPWAQKYVAERGAIKVESVDDVMRWLATPERITQQTGQRQLALDLA